MCRTIPVALLLLGSTAPAWSQSSSTDPLKVLSSKRLQKDLRLTRRQLQRVEELMLQWQGPKALLRKDIARKVGLSATQQKKVKKIYDDQELLEFRYYKFRRTDRDKARILYKELRESAKTLKVRVLSVLTEIQLRKFDRLLGTPFDRSKMYDPIPDV